MQLERGAPQTNTAEKGFTQTNTAERGATSKKKKIYEHWA